MTPARLLCVALTDAVGDRRTQNQPGTTDEYPNWRLPLADGETDAVLANMVHFFLGLPILVLFLIYYQAPLTVGELARQFREERPIDDIEFVRTVAVARITMPRSMVRLSAGRESMSESTQALCFLAGANSIFYGERLLTTDNPGVERDRELFRRLLSPATRLPDHSGEPARIAHPR